MKTISSVKKNIVTPQPITPDTLHVVPSIPNPPPPPKEHEIPEVVDTKPAYVQSKVDNHDLISGKCNELYCDGYDIHSVIPIVGGRFLILGTRNK